MFQFGDRSRKSLEGVHPDLVKVMMHAITISPIDFMILEGMRSAAQEAENVAKGVSQTMHSRHLPNRQGFACAVDIGAWVGGKIDWTYNHYVKLAVAIKHAAEQVSVPIEWGGDWQTLKDGGHYQLPWAGYP